MILGIRLLEEITSMDILKRTLLDKNSDLRRAGTGRRMVVGNTDPSFPRINNC